MELNINQLCIRPVIKSEEPRYRELIQQRQYLGELAKIAYTLWYVATYDAGKIKIFPHLPGSVAFVTAGLVGIFVINLVGST
jgi:hypothetical protein